MSTTEATAPVGELEIGFDESEIEEMRRRISATRWPERETVDDDSQGVPLATMQELARYWATDYDWRKAEAKLNALPQFVTTIDSLDIHFIHVRSRQPNALPLIITHGWPGSVIEQLKIIDPLTNPTAHGASASDAFDLVLPSLPGYGFSDKPTGAGWGVPRIAQTFSELMSRLGYARYGAQGGDWGSIISAVMTRLAPDRILGFQIGKVITMITCEGRFIPNPNGQPGGDYTQRRVVRARFVAAT